MNLVNYIHQHLLHTYNTYINNILEEKDTTKPTKAPVKRSDIMFTIWETPYKKVNWLKDNFSYTKIEYKYYNKKDDIEIDFLLGFNDGTWKLWIGKIGVISYDDIPYCSLNCIKFQDAIMKGIDKIEEFVKKVKKDPNNYVQYYLHL